MIILTSLAGQADQPWFCNSVGLDCKVDLR